MTTLCCRHRLILPRTKTKNRVATYRMDASHVVFSDRDDVDSTLNTSLVYSPGNSNVQITVWYLRMYALPRLIKAVVLTIGLFSFVFPPFQTKIKHDVFVHVRLLVRRDGQAVPIALVNVVSKEG
jgi:hypothetical protein